MALSLTNYLAQGVGTSKRPFALSVITDSEKYALSVDRTTDNTDVRTVPVTVGTTMGALLAPTTPSQPLALYDQANAVDWSISASTVQSGNKEGYIGFAIDETNEKVCTLIAHASTGNGSDDYVHFWYNEFAIASGTSTTGSAHNDLLTKAQGTTLRAETITGDIFANVSATEYKVYWWDSAADDIRTITANRSTKNLTLGTMGRHGTGQSNIYPQRVSYVSADETIYAAMGLNASKDMTIHVNYSDATTGLWHYNVFKIWDEELGVAFPAGLDTSVDFGFWVMGDYLWLGRYTDSSSNDVIGNRAFLRSEFDQWLLSLMTTGT